MPISSSTDGPRQRSELGPLALAALSKVLRESQRSNRDRALTQLYDAARRSDRDACEVAVADLIASGLTAGGIVDGVLPDIARRLGAEWAEDELDFFAVTAGCSHLTALLPALERMAKPPFPGSGHSPEAQGARLVLRGLPGNQHRFGLTLLAGQLRRAGHAATLMAADTPADRAPPPCDALLISTTGQDSLCDIRAAVRAGHAAGAMVALGGPGLSEVPDLCATAGADMVTSNVQAVLAACAPAAMRHGQRPVGPSV